MGVSIVSLLELPVCADDKPAYLANPRHKASPYDYSDDDIPDVCFFPKETARWDGYKVNNWTWLQLTDFQKTAFVSEGIAEIEKTENVIVIVENRWRILNSVNDAAAMMREKFPMIKTPMIKILSNSLKDAGHTKRKPPQ